jgi:hypothetical protein
MIDKIVAERSGGNAAMASVARTKLMLKGIVPKDFTETSPDDPAMIAKIRAAATELGVKL